MSAGDTYIDKMYFGTSLRGFPHHWKDELPFLEKELTELLAERNEATGKPDSEAVVTSLNSAPHPPAATFLSGPVEQARAGSPFVVHVKVNAPNGVKMIRLRYRHLNQKEDYKIAQMTRLADSEIYSANIPGDFITPEWGHNVLHRNS